jgi:hypothetical protein
VIFATIILCVASQRLFIFVDFVIDSVLKLLDTPSYKAIILLVLCMAMKHCFLLWRKSVNDKCLKRRG